MRRDKARSATPASAPLCVQVDVVGRCRSDVFRRAVRCCSFGRARKKVEKDFESIDTIHKFTRLRIGLGLTGEQVGGERALELRDGVVRRADRRHHCRWHGVRIIRHE